MAAEVFIDDDPGFLDWRDAHPDGFIVNAGRKPTADYLMLHRTNCSFMHLPVAPGRWTRDFRKVCAGTAEELADWAKLEVAEYRGLKPCHYCKP